MPTLDRHGEVFVLDLGDGENMIEPEMVGGVNALLDEVERAPEPRALVTCGRGKCYSTGLDLGWMAAHQDGIEGLATSMHELFAGSVHSGPQRPHRRPVPPQVAHEAMTSGRRYTAIASLRDAEA